ncbi:MAG: adenylyltransferase/cytidyltransferase family protein [bacterium]|nr:adenylyltransferase/cytidyltransferase family protein [bacterium]
MDNLTKPRKKRVVVFGIFDGVHKGHRSLFSQAKQHGDELIVIVGRDSSSIQWKEKKPKHNEKERLKLVSKELGVDLAVLGDEEQSSYKVLEELSPDVICLGYDQDSLEQDLILWLAQKGKKTPLFRLQPFEPSVYHNSFRA